MFKQTKGFSLLELLIVLAILGVLAGIGFVNLPRDRFAVNQAAEGLARDVQLARFEAIRRNTFVDLQIDVSDNRYRILRADNGAIIKTVTFGTQATPQVELGSVSNGDRITFDARGIAADGGGTDVVFRNRSGTYERAVNINTQGRASIK